MIHAASGRSLSFADLATAAAVKTPPKNPPLKPASEWKLIGKALPRVDTAEKISGAAVFGIDFRVPNMVCAAVKTCPVFDGKVASVDRSSIAGMPGVLGIVDIPNGVAVAAESWWQAKEAVDALGVTWDYGAKSAISSAGLADQYKQALASDGWFAAHLSGDKAAFRQAFPTNLSAVRIFILVRGFGFLWSCKADWRTDVMAGRDPRTWTGWIFTRDLWTGISCRMRFTM